MHTKSEIAKAYLQSVEDVKQWFESLPADKFNQGPEGKWDASTHLDHLIQVQQQLNKAFRAPRFVLKYKFGKSNREPRTYDQTVARYQDKLQYLKGDPPGMTMKSHGPEKKQTLVDLWQKQGDKLASSIKGWKDADMDQYLLPHPLVGKMHIREFYQWNVYHNLHHLKNLQENYG